MDQILSLTENDISLEGFKFSESLSGLYEMFKTWAIEKMEWLMTKLRQYAPKFSKKVFMKKECAEDIEDIVNATLENIVDLKDIDKTINADKDGADVTADTARVQDIAAELNEGTNTAKTRIQEDNEFSEEAKNADPTASKNFKLKEFNLGSIKKLMQSAGTLLKDFMDGVAKLFSKNKPNASEVESQHKPRLAKHLYVAIGAIITLIGVILTSVHFVK